MERLYITQENFSYPTSILNYADFIYALVQERTQDPYVVVNSIIRDPFNEGELQLQHNVIVVNQIYKFVITAFLRAQQTTPDNYLTWLIGNIYLKVLDPQHDFPAAEFDLEFCAKFADFIFKFRKMLVNIGEQKVVGDLFANILARIHITLELIKMIDDMKKEEAIRIREGILEPAEL